MKNHNRKGQYAHLDREYKTAYERKAFQDGVAALMAKNQARPMPFDIHCQPPSNASEAARLGADAIAAIHRGNAYQAGLYAREAYQLARQEAQG